MLLEAFSDELTKLAEGARGYARGAAYTEGPGGLGDPMLFFRPSSYKGRGHLTEGVSSSVRKTMKLPEISPPKTPTRDTTKSLRTARRESGTGGMGGKF